MINTYKHKGLTWIDVESPETDEIKSLMAKYAIHPIVAEELLRPTIRPKVDAYQNFVYLVLHFPVFEHDRKSSASCEIDFIMGKNFLITVHYKSITPLYEITKLFEVGTMLNNHNSVKNPGKIVYFIIRQFYDFALRQLEHIQVKIDKIEDNIFKEEEQDMVEMISCVRRDTLNFQRSFHAHLSVLTSLEMAGVKFYGVEFTHYAKSMIGELSKVKSLLDNSKETIESLQTTNDSMLTDKTNDIMRTLSILAFLTFPLMLFAAVFSMNTISTPILGIKGDFWIIVGLMLISTTTMVYIFKRKRWL